MALKEYEVEVNGVATRMILNDEDAKALTGAKEVGSVETRTAASETRQEDKSKATSTKRAAEPENK